MDSNEILASARIEFFEAFELAMAKALPLCAEALYRKAEVSRASADQARLLNARSVLTDKTQSALLTRELSTAMERLLNRSLQTTYSTFRPNSALAFNADSLALVDANAFEDELRIGDMTVRFRSEAEELLRDLNIRIALLFDQVTIKERENPFRPYLFSRSIVTALENLGISSEVGIILRDQLSISLAPFVSSIYSQVNSHFAKHGVAAQLQLKIQKSPVPPTPTASKFDSAGEWVPENLDTDAMRSEISYARPKRKIAQLFQTVRGFAAALTQPNAHANSPAIPQFNPQTSPPRAQENLKSFTPSSAMNNAMDAGDHDATWLHSEQSLGGALRRFFSPDRDTEIVAISKARLRQAAAVAAQKVPGNLSDAEPAYEAARGGADTATPNSIAPLYHSLDQLQRELTPSSAQMMSREGGIRNLIIEYKESLTRSAQSIDEKMTIDVVAMLFEFILRDSQIPAEVRAQLGRLQFLVLKIALADVTLLTQKGHPARMLVNRIGSISLGLKQVDPGGAQVTDEICRIVETLLHDDSENTHIFAKMLDEFDAFIALELRASSEEMEGAVAAVEQVQNRTLRFTHIVAQTAEAIMGLTIDPFLQEFLKNTWSRAIELAGRTDAKQANRFRLLVPDLLWSIIPKLNSDDKAQLFALLPISINILREGLALIAWDESNKKQLLDWLVDAHTNALRVATQTSPLPTLPEIHAHFSNFANESNDACASPDAKLDQENGKQFLEDAIKELDLQIKLLDTMLEDEIVGVEPLPESPETWQQFKQKLINGVAIELSLAGKPCLGRLNSVNPNFENFVLTIDGDKSPSIVGARVFKRLLHTGRVRFLESQPLFDRAVDSLLKSADELDCVA